MKAVVWTGSGSPDVLQLRDLAKPTPKNNEVLIRIHTTTVTSGDCEIRGLTGLSWYSLPLPVYVGLRRPSRITILGMELSGVIELVGDDVKQFSEGDQVFGATGFVGMGTCAEYMCLPEEPEGGALAMKPANMTHDEAAAVPVGAPEALRFLRQATAQSGERVLINGAGGTVGMFAVQLARYFGADVTAVDRENKLDLLRSIGANQVIDYARDDLTKYCVSYDVIIDMVGKTTFSSIVGVLVDKI